MAAFMALISPNQILFGWSNLDECDKGEIEHVWWSEEVHTECWWVNRKERGRLEDSNVDAKVILQ
jgi:hypothetical protein